MQSKMAELLDKLDDPIFVKQFEKDFKDFSQSYINRQNYIHEKAKKINYQDLYNEICKFVDLNDFIAFSPAESELAEVKIDALSIKIKAFFNIKSLFSEIPYQNFTHDNLGSEIRFTDWFVPIIVKGKKCVLESISGQGETFIVINSMTKLQNQRFEESDNAYNAVFKWFQLEEILNS